MPCVNNQKEQLKCNFSIENSWLDQRIQKCLLTLRISSSSSMSMLPTAAAAAVTGSSGSCKLFTSCARLPISRLQKHEGWEVVVRYWLSKHFGVIHFLHIHEPKKLRNLLRRFFLFFCYSSLIKPKFGMCYTHVVGTLLCCKQVSNIYHLYC